MLLEPDLVVRPNHCCVVAAAADNNNDFVKGK